jgi:hypothetical protein
MTKQKVAKKVAPTTSASTISPNPTAIGPGSTATIGIDSGLRESVEQSTVPQGAAHDEDGGE